MSEFQASNFKKENGGAPNLLGKTELTSPYFFVPPSGDTASRPQSCAAGTLRFNTDAGTIEVYRGDTIGWEQIQRVDNQYLGGGTGSNTGLGTRAVTPGGNSNPDSTSESMSYLTISTLGNSQDFGDLNAGINANAGGSSRTRGLSVGGSFIPARTNTIEFFTFSTLGNASNFGDITSERAELGFTSNNVRGIAAGGSPTSNDEVMDYITIAVTGNAIDFGDLTVEREGLNQGCISNGNRGIFSGGNTPSAYINTIEFVTIMTTGNATDFGDLFQTNSRQGGCCSSTRGLLAGGMTPSAVNNIEFITIATLGNSIDFGDLTVSRNNLGAASSPTRGLFLGGGTPSMSNVVDFVEIATTGDAQDFGDMDTAGATNGGIRPTGASSNGHGGL